MCRDARIHVFLFASATQSIQLTNCKCLQVYKSLLFYFILFYFILSPSLSKFVFLWSTGRVVRMVKTWIWNLQASTKNQQVMVCTGASSFVFQALTINFHVCGRAVSCAGLVGLFWLLLFASRIFLLQSSSWWRAGKCSEKLRWSGLLSANFTLVCPQTHWNLLKLFWIPTKKDQTLRGCSQAHWQRGEKPCWCSACPLETVVIHPALKQWKVT